MSILIKGMKMPRSCDYCPFLIKKKGFVPYCGITADLDLRSFDNDGRLRNCPLVEVPTPHGRLIDADALMLAILDAQVDQPELAEVYDEDYHVVLDWLRVAPTVIEAEE